MEQIHEKSLARMIAKLCDFAGSRNFTEWETGFITSIDYLTERGALTCHLSCKQELQIEKLYNKYF